MKTNGDEWFALFIGALIGFAIGAIIVGLLGPDQKFTNIPFPECGERVVVQGDCSKNYTLEEVP